MRNRSLYLLGAITAPLVLLAACDDRDAQPTPAANQNIAEARPGPAAKLAEARDGNWVNISGRIVSTTPNSFLLDYGRGRITVEMDDWDWYQEGKLLRPGDEVVVTGRVDNDFVPKKRIEASSVFVKNLNTFFYASAADEEQVPTTTVFVSPAPSFVDATGTVTAIEGRELTLGAAAGPIRVDTSALPDNPLDNKGFQQIKIGDRLYVWGDLDLERSENPELKARGIVTLTKDQKKSSKAQGSGGQAAS